MSKQKLPDEENPSKFTATRLITDLDDVLSDLHNSTLAKADGVKQVFGEPIDRYMNDCAFVAEVIEHELNSRGGVDMRNLKAKVKFWRNYGNHLIPRAPGR